MYNLYSEHLHIVNILSETDSLLILKSVSLSPYSEHFAAANGVHYMESLLYYVLVGEVLVTGEEERRTLATRMMCDERFSPRSPSSVRRRGRRRDFGLPEVTVFLSPRRGIGGSETFRVVHTWHF